MTLLKNLAGALAATAIAIAGLGASATPARALDSDELFRFLLGAASIAIIVHAYNERSARSGRRYTGNILPDQCIETMRTRGRNIEVYNARCLRDAGMTRLPSSCERTIRTNRGSRAVFSASCLERAGYVPEYRLQQQPRRSEPPRRYGPPRAILLPSSCELTYRDRGLRIAGYYADCLERAGLRNLPGACSLRARLGSQPRTIYNADCLVDYGYRAEGSSRR